MRPLPTPTPTILLTRPARQAERFAAALRERLGDVAVLISPVLDIWQAGMAVDLAGIDGVVLSSENGARALAAVADVTGKRAWCVGDRTAKVARGLGMQAVSAAGDAGALVGLVAGVAPRGRLLFAHGSETRGDVAGRLRAAGCEVLTREVYQQVEAPLTKAALAVLDGPAPVIAPLFSPRSARLLGAQAIGARAPLALVALSEAVARDWTGPKPRSFTVAAHPDADHMLDEVATIWTALAA